MVCPNRVAATLVGVIMRLRSHIAGRPVWYAACAAVALLATGCDDGARSSAESSPTASTSAPAPTPGVSDGGLPVTADLLVTASGRQTPDEIRALGDLDSYGLLRDGTRLTVWADMRRYGDSRQLVRRAFWWESPDGVTRSGRLPDGIVSMYSEQPVVVPGRHGFVVSGAPPVLIRDGRAVPFRPGPGRDVRDGDVVAAASAGHVLVLRPQSATEHFLPLPRGGRPLTAAGGHAYGFVNAPVTDDQYGYGPPVDLRVASWTGEGPWAASFAVGLGYDLEAAAAGDRAAVWVCDEGGHGWGGDGRSCASYGMAITRDGGSTWDSLPASERPFSDVDDAVAVDGTLWVDGWPRGHWRSVDDQWTQFTQVTLPRNAMLHAEDGFATAAVYDDDRVTVYRLTADGATGDPWVIDTPDGRLPKLGSGPGYAELIGAENATALIDPDGRAPSRLATRDGVVVPDALRGDPIATDDGLLFVDHHTVEASELVDAAGEVQGTQVGEPDALRPGDVLVTAGGRVRYSYPAMFRHEQLWAFRSSDRTFRQLAGPDLNPTTQVTGLVDDQGDGWLLQGNTLWRSTDGGASWMRSQVPGLSATGSRPSELGSCRRDLVVVGPPHEVLRLRTDAGSWSSIPLPPMPTHEPDVALLPDCRLLLGPVAGSLWRGTTATNRSFEHLSAGPLGQIAVAGDAVYGVPLSPLFDERVARPLPEDSKTVWLSDDAGTHWTAVGN